jgi:hypothetical protein
MVYWAKQHANETTLVKLNRCRLYMEVATLAEMVSGAANTSSNIGAKKTSNKAITKPNGTSNKNLIKRLGSVEIIDDFIGG